MPRPLLLALAAAVVIVTAIAADSARPTPMLPTPGRRFRGERHLPVPERLAQSAALVVLVGLALTLALGTGGPAGLARLVVSWGWWALVPVALLLGDVWPRINPLRIVSAGLAGARPAQTVHPLPEGVGVRPAAALLLGLVWLDVAVTATPPMLLVAMIVVALLVVGGTLFWGAAWISACDPIELVTGMVGRLAGGRQAQRREMLPSGGLAALAVLLGARVFDVAGPRPVQAVANSGGEVAASSVGLLVSVGLVWALARVAARPPILASALVPLAAGYAFLHDVPALLTAVDTGALAASPVAVALVAAFLSAHAAAVVLAQRITAPRFDPRSARAAQFPLRVSLLASAVVGVAAFTSPT